jgi:hypothetical protein
MRVSSFSIILAHTREVYLESLSDIMTDGKNPLQMTLLNSISAISSASAVFLVGRSMMDFMTMSEMARHASYP